MPQMVSRGATQTPPTGVITVADLLNRYAPSREVPADPVTAPTVSVGSLLAREGRTPARAAAPVRSDYDSYDPSYDPAYDPGGVADDAVADDEPSADRTRTTLLVRRGAIVAGTLLAAGSVFGAAVVSDATISQSGSEQALDSYPGQGRLDQPSAPVEAVPTVVDPTAQTGMLDPGVGAPTSWLPVAFPGATEPAPGADEPRSGGGSGTPAAGGSGGSGGAGGSAPSTLSDTPPQGGGSTSTDDQSDGVPSGGSSGDDSDGGSSSDDGDDPSDSDSGGLLGGVVGGVGGVVGSLGASLLG